MFDFNFDETDIRTKQDCKYSWLEIESLKDLLETLAQERGQAHSDNMVKAGREPTPEAYQATFQWKAIEVIEQLQIALKQATDGK